MKLIKKVKELNKFLADNSVKHDRAYVGDMVFTTYAVRGSAGDIEGYLAIIKAKLERVLQQGQRLHVRKYIEVIAQKTRTIYPKDNNITSIYRVYFRLAIQAGRSFKVETTKGEDFPVLDVYSEKEEGMPAKEVIHGPYQEYLEDYEIS